MKRLEQILDNIRIQRLKKGYTQEFMATKLGCNYTSYGKIESGKTALTLERLFEISDVLKVAASQLLNVEDDEKKEMTFSKVQKARVLLEIELSAEDLKKLGDIDKFISAKAKKVK